MEQIKTLDRSAAQSTPSLLRRATGTGHFWFALAFFVRLSALAGLALIGVARHQRSFGGSRNVVSSALDLLRNRTTFVRLTADEQAYDEIAQNIVAGRGFVTDSGWLIAKGGEPTAYAGCGYPVFVALSYVLFGNGNQLAFFLIQILLSSLAVYLLFRRAREVAGLSAARIASFYYVFDPLLIWLSVTMMSEALVGPLLIVYVTLLAYALKDEGRYSWMVLPALGLDTAVLAETRSITFSLALAAFALIGLKKTEGKIAIRTNAARCSIVIMIFVAVCAPWAIRNYLLWHRWIPFSTKSGTNAYMFNHPGLLPGLGKSVVVAKMPVDVYSSEIQNLPNEPARDQKLMGLFVTFLRNNPWKVTGLTLSRFLISVLPISSTESGPLPTLLACYSKLPILILLALVVIRFRSVPFAADMVPEIATVLCWHAGQSLAGPGLRFRAPVDFVYSVIVGVLAAALLERSSVEESERPSTAE